jgi:hypothetical protein
VRYLRQHQKRPFFLYLHYDGPHAPYWTPPGYPVKGARPPGGPNDVQFEQYLGEAKWTDEHLGPIFQELERLGLEKDTVVVVTGDHGEIFHSAHDVIYGENNRTLHNHGFSLYQEVLNVPLILSAPGTVPAGRRVTAPVSHLDLVPTLLDLAGVPAMKGHQGQSLAPTILRNAPVPERPIISEGRWLFAIRRGKWRLLHRLGPMRAFRRPTGSRHFVVDELYDVEADPHETRNLAAENPEVVKRLREELLGVFAPGEKSTGPEASEDVFGAAGLRLSLRLHGGTGPHKLEGTAACDGAVVVRSLQGPTSHAAYRGRGKVALLLEAPGTRPAGVEVEFVGCPASSIALDLTLDGKPLKAHQVMAGPYGLRLVDQPTRLPLGHLPALVSRRPPPLGSPNLPQVHLWLGGSDTGAFELDGSGGSQAGKLADQMLRDAGYAKGPGGSPVPAPPSPPPPAGGAP